MTRLTGKKALVTGASRGIGKAIALRLAQVGCVVGIHYHDNQPEAVAQQIRDAGGMAYLFMADFEQPQQAASLAEEAWQTMQGIDILVNNVGVSFKKHFLDFTEADIDYFQNINYKSTFLLTQAIARRMVAEGRAGDLYTITSVNGVRPNFGQSAYGASKYALESLMKGAALELAVHNIRVNTFALGAIESDMTAPVMADPVALGEVNAGIPMGRFGQPDEVAAVLVDLLASGSYLTGATITIDGGLLLMRGYGKTQPYERS